MSTREYQQQNVSGPPNDGFLSPLDEPRGQPPRRVTTSSATGSDFGRFTEYEFIDSRELARRLTVPPSWIRDQVRARSEDPLPHLNLGRYVLFLSSSPELYT